MLTKHEYAVLTARCAAHDAIAAKYIQRNGWTVIPADVVASWPAYAAVSNEQRSAMAVFEFMEAPPAKYMLYVDAKRGIATTWTGDKLGDIGLGEPYRASFGDTRRAISVWAINGRYYTGTYYQSAGDYARVTLRKVKG